MDEELIAKLIAQIKTLSESVDLVLQRFEQLFSMQRERGEAMHQTEQERLTVLHQLVEQAQNSNEQYEIAREAMVQSLDQLDAATDDIARATAGLLTIQQQQNAEAAAQTSGG